MLPLLPSDFFASGAECGRRVEGGGWQPRRSAPIYGEKNNDLFLLFVLLCTRNGSREQRTAQKVRSPETNHRDYRATCKVRCTPQSPVTTLRGGGSKRKP